MTRNIGESRRQTRVKERGKSLRICTDMSSSPRICLMGFTAFRLASLPSSSLPLEGQGLYLSPPYRVNPSLQSQALVVLLLAGPQGMARALNYSVD